MARWTPSSYLKRGNSEGYRTDYLSKLSIDGRLLLNKNLPVVFTLSHLAKIVDVRYRYLWSIVQRKKDPYRSFSITKRSGGKRPISVPSPNLLKTQRWINQNILQNIPAHPRSTAYSKENSPFKNSQLHCGENWIVKIDLKNFFESITENSVYHVFRKIGYPPLLAFQLARLCTKSKILADGSPSVGRLPQGAPTSPLLSNLVCIPFDNKMCELAETYGCIYSRYADDIVFSCYDFDRDRASKLIRAVDEIIKIYSFKRNHKKTKVIPPNARKVVTGLLVNGEQPRLQKKFKDNIRAHLYFAKKRGLNAHCIHREFDSIIGFRNHLYGLILYSISVEKSFGLKCLTQFESIQWPDFT